MKRSLLLLALVLACDRAPAEPDSTPATGSAVRSEDARPLQWTVPPGWSTERTAKHGTYRAKYRVPNVGNDKHPADVIVSYLGRGAQADPAEALNRWMKEFDGDVAAGARRETFDVGTIRVRRVEVQGTYKLPMGPPVGPRGRAAAHVIKKGWRGIAAGVSTPDRGAWFFRLVGPDDTVQAARSGMDSLLRSVH